MKVVLLAGGYGTRLSELTDHIPKPMVEIGNIPILIHIMNHYSSYGHNEFIIACGYKSEYIKKYFNELGYAKNDFEIDYSTGSVNILSKNVPDWKVTLVDTGLDTMTGGRIKKLSKYIDGEDFLLTYGDGLSDIDINESIKTYKECNKKLLMTVVRPPARFGEVIISGTSVEKFEEKPQLNHGWINGGFFVCSNSILNYIKKDSEMFEREPLSKLCSENELCGYIHEGFWQCMDSKKDLDKLNNIWASGKIPWKI